MKHSKRIGGSAAPFAANSASSFAGASGAKAPGIKEIAKAAGVSIGTVDRALHSRSGISTGTRDKIMRMAEHLGYRPNLSARYLKLGHRPKMLVHLPQETASYFDTVREGIRQAAAPFQSILDLEFHSYPSVGKGDVESLRGQWDLPCDGIILSPSSRMASLIRKATARGVPVVCVATDAPKTDRLTAISCDPFTGGAVAAELLSLARKHTGEVAIVTGDLSVFDHSEKVRGFQFMLSELHSSMSLVKVVEAHDEYGEAYLHTRSLLQRYPRLSAIYVNTSNSSPVIKALAESGRMNQIDVVVTDLFPEIVPLIRAGKLLATLYQRPLTQGRMAFEALYHFIMEGTRPRPVNKLIPHVVLRSNIDLFIENLSVELDIQKAGKGT